jgi:hypothetical protein
MSAEKVELVRRLYEAYMARDNAWPFEVYDPDIEWDLSRMPWLVEMGTEPVCHGHEGVSAWAVLTRFGAEALPCAQPVAQALCHPGQSRPATGRGTIGDHELDLGVRPPGGTVVTTIMGRDDRAHEVEVR